MLHPLHPHTHIHICRDFPACLDRGRHPLPKQNWAMTLSLLLRVQEATAYFYLQEKELHTLCGRLLLRTAFKEKGFPATFCPPEVQGEIVQIFDAIQFPRMVMQSEIWSRFLFVCYLFKTVCTVMQILYEELLFYCNLCSLYSEILWYFLLSAVFQVMCRWFVFVSLMN